MALLDPFAISDPVPQTAIQQDVVLSNRTDSAAGSGTVIDPYNAGGTSTDTDPPFDRILRSLAALGTPITVRLLPGTYYTRGFPSTGSQGWKPFSALRIVGSGQLNTFLVRSGTPSTGHNAVVGNDYTSTNDFLDAFEISDLTINASYVSTSGVALSGIAVSGRAMLIHRVRVTNFGSNSSTVPALGISIARAHTSAPYMPENCVVQEAAVDTPNASNPLFGIHLSSETEGFFHQFCVVRNCYVNLPEGFGFSNGYIGIAAGGGLGTIIEHNRILNCKYGIRLPNVNSTRDMIIRHNCIRRTFAGIDLDMATAVLQTVARLIVINNLIDWPTTGEFASAVRGIFIQGTGTRFLTVAIRDNFIRRRDNNGTLSDESIKVTGWDKSVVDNNVTDIGALFNGIEHPNPSFQFTTFNNLKSDGSLICAYNTDTGLFDQCLETETADLDMMLFKR